jgi:hypothetical protein
VVVQRKCEESCDPHGFGWQLRAEENLSVIVGDARVPLRRRVGYIYLEARQLLDYLLFTTRLSRTSLPVPHYRKRRIIREHARARGLRIMVETGAYMGDMLSALAADFDRLYSVELDPELHRKAVQRFHRHQHIHVLAGDSAERLPEVLNSLDADALFWLDAHYSGLGTARAAVDSPVSRELELVLGHPGRHHTVLIDDANCFVGSGGYPTIEALRAEAARLRPHYSFDVRDNIVRLVPLPRP